MNWDIYGAKLVEARQKPNIMLTAACHILRPAYLHSRNTATQSSAAADTVTVNQSPPFYDERMRLFPRLLFNSDSAAASMQEQCGSCAVAVQFRDSKGRSLSGQPAVMKRAACLPA